jgi:hypothetical protein
MPRFRKSAASLAVLVLVFPAQLQAVRAGTCRCACCTAPEENADGAPRGNPVGSEAIRASASADCACGACACSGEVDRPSDRPFCGCCRCHSQWHATAAFPAPLKKPKNAHGHGPSIIATTNPVHPPSGDSTRRRAALDPRLPHGPTNDLGTLLCRFRC